MSTHMTPQCASHRNSGYEGFYNRQKKTYNVEFYAGGQNKLIGRTIQQKFKKKPFSPFFDRKLKHILYPSKFSLKKQKFEIFAKPSLKLQFSVKQKWSLALAQERKPPTKQQNSKQRERKTAQIGAILLQRESGYFLYFRRGVSDGAKSKKAFFFWRKIARQREA